MLNKKKTGKTEANAEPRAAAPKSATAARQPLWVAVLGSALAAAASGLVLLLLVMQISARAQLEQIAQARAEGAAGRLQQLLDDRSQQLTALARSAGAVAAARSEDPMAAPQAAAELRRHLPAADRVLLMPLDRLGSARLGVSEQGLRNNIEVDMARRAHSTGNTVQELYRLGNRWLFSLAAPVTADGKTIDGMVLASFDSQVLQSALEQAGDIGAFELQQRFRDSRPVSVLKTGRGSGAPLARAGLYETWQLEFTPASATVASVTGIPLLGWLVVALGALLAALLAFLGLRAQEAAVAADMQQLAGYLKTAADRPNAEAPAFKRPDTAALAAQVAGQLRNLRAKAVEAAAAASKAPAAAAAKAVEAAPPATAPEPLFQEMEILDLDSLDDLDDTLLLDDSGFLDSSFQASAPLPAEIFRAYDIRGLAESQLSADVAYRIGRGIAAEAQEHQQKTVAVGRDGRISSPMLRDNLIRGLTEGGCDVLDIGIVPSPVLYFANYQLNTQTGVMITGSHNPAPYNGMKIVIAGKTLAGERIQQLRERIEAGNFTEGQGQVSTVSVSDDYIQRITGDVAVAQPLKVVVDAGNGAAGEIAPRLLQELGCEVIPLFCDIDGTFPNHHPDPSETKNLADLIAAVRKHGADLGVAFDGDGDRIGVVTASGQIVMPDRLLMLFAQDIVARNPGADIIFDIKCTRQLSQVISSYGGRPIMWRSGHSHIKEKMVETGALLGGELSGHIFFKERWYGFDDGLYSAARLIEILSTSHSDLDAQLSEFPDSLSTPEIKLEVNESEKFELIDKLSILGQFGNGKVSTIDGVRVDFEDGWGLIRASNTTPCLTLRFEADTEAALERIQDLFREQLGQVDAALSAF